MDCGASDIDDGLPTANMWAEGGGPEITGGTDGHFSFPSNGIIFSWLDDLQRLSD